MAGRRRPRSRSHRDRRASEPGRYALERMSRSTATTVPTAAPPSGSVSMWFRSFPRPRHRIHRRVLPRRATSATCSVSRAQATERRSSPQSSRAGPDGVRVELLDADISGAVARPTGLLRMEWYLQEGVSPVQLPVGEVALQCGEGTSYRSADFIPEAMATIVGPGGSLCGSRSTVRSTNRSGFVRRGSRRTATVRTLLGGRGRYEASGRHPANRCRRNGRLPGG